MLWEVFRGKGDCYKGFGFRPDTDPCNRHPMRMSKKGVGTLVAAFFDF